MSEIGKHGTYIQSSLRRHDLGQVRMSDSGSMIQPREQTRLRSQDPFANEADTHGGRHESPSFSQSIRHRSKHQVNAWNSVSLPIKDSNRESNVWFDALIESRRGKHMLSCPRATLSADIRVGRTEINSSPVALPNRRTTSSLIGPPSHLRPSNQGVSQAPTPSTDAPKIVPLAPRPRSLQQLSPKAIQMDYDKNFIFKTSQIATTPSSPARTAPRKKSR